MQPLSEQKKQAQGLLSPAPNRDVAYRNYNNISNQIGRQNSISRNPSQDNLSAIINPSYLQQNGLQSASRADKSALNHIQRIRRNMPSQQNSRQMSRDVSAD